MRLHNLPMRLATGAFFLNSGLGKWNSSPEQAAGIHGMAANAYPFLASVPPQVFAKAISASEITTAGLLLAPFVPRKLAGAALTAFAAGLVGMYLRTDQLHKPGSVAPTEGGIAIAKDSWILSIGMSLLLEKDPSTSDRQS